MTIERPPATVIRPSFYNARCRTTHVCPRLTVLDDGVGIAPRIGGGSGVRGMRERALLLGASLRVEPRLPGGTQVVLDIPSTEVVAREQNLSSTASPAA